MALSEEQLRSLIQGNTSGFNFRLPDGEIISTVVNPGQAATINAQAILSGSASPPGSGPWLDAILNATSEQLKAKNATPQYYANGAVMALNDNSAGQQLAQQSAAQLSQLGIAQVQPGTNAGVAAGTPMQQYTTPSGQIVMAPSPSSTPPPSGTLPTGTKTFAAQQGTTNTGQPAEQPLASAQLPQAPQGQNAALATAAIPQTVLQPGATGADVQRLQDYLVSQGLLTQTDLAGGYGTYGPKTTAAVAALQAKLGVDNTTGVGFYGPRTIAALSKGAPGMPTGLSGVTNYDSTPAGASTPAIAADPYANLDPVAKQVKMYTDAYNALGLQSIKQQYDKFLKDQLDITNEMNDKIAAVRNDPWLPESEADRNVERIRSKYETRLETLTNLLNYTDSIYRQGIAQVETVVSGAQADMRAANELAQKQIDAEAKLLEADNQIIEANGRKLLVDTRTGRIVADLGAATSGGSSGKPPTAAQETVATYATRIEQALPTFATGGTTVNAILKMSPAQFALEQNLPSSLQSAQMQQYSQAARNFINAVLRRESGAVISPTEFVDAYAQYLPKPGDTQATLQQKENNRKIVFATFKNGAGPAFQSVEQILGPQPLAGGQSPYVAETTDLEFTDSSPNLLQRIGSYFGI